MTLAGPTLLDSRIGATGTSVASASITPSSNSLLVVVARMNQDRTASLAMSTTLSNVGSWTIVSQFSSTNAGGTIMIAYAMVTGSPGTGTVTASWTSSSVNTYIQVMEFTGHDTTTPVVQSKQGTGGTTGTTHSLTLDATPRSTSIVVGAITSANSTNVTPGANFTEIADAGSAAATCESEYDALSATTTVNWGGLVNTNGRVGVAIEVAELVTWVPKIIML